jgi:hypothetical protein
MIRISMSWGEFSDFNPSLDLTGLRSPNLAELLAGLAHAREGVVKREGLAHARLVAVTLAELLLLT